MDNASGDRTVLVLTARVVAAHVGHNDVGVGALPGLIRAVYDALSGIQAAPRPAPKATPELDGPVPAVEPEQSVFKEHIICLEDGKKQKTLKRHLHSAHGLTPEAYRTRWGLPASYPMVAPAYAERRSELAKSIGLGTKRVPKS